jgi:hypothetical protein
MGASFAFASGAKGFFTARPLVAWLAPAGTIEATSFYDTRDLKHNARTFGGLRSPRHRDDPLQCRRRQCKDR